MILKYRIKILILALFCTIQIPNLLGQTPDATADFVKTDLSFTTTPEHPAICNVAKGIKVTVNEPFDEIEWIRPGGRIGPKGQMMVLNEIGEWTIRVSKMVNGASCSHTQKLKVMDIGSSTAIAAYFNDAGFWAVDIFRDPPLGGQLCRNCECSYGLEEVSFQDNGTRINLAYDAFENFGSFKPFEGMEYNKGITNNNCLCDNDGESKIEEFERTLGSGDLSVWGHQFFINETTPVGKLYLKASMEWQAVSPVGEHRSRLNQILSQIISQNTGALNQARVLFTNLFMTQPIGGYNLLPSCPDPDGCFADGSFVTPSGALSKLPQGGSNFVFGDGSKGPKGSMLFFKDLQGKDRNSFKYKVNAFAGYFNEISADVTSDLDFVAIDQNGTNRIVLIEKGINDCFKSIVPYNGINTNSDLWGGVGYNIIEQNTINAITPIKFETIKPGDSKISLMAPTARIISLPRNFSNLTLTYNNTVDATVENFVGGMLWTFELIDEITCEVSNSFVYQPGSSHYLDEKTGEIYKDNYGNVMDFVFPMNCNGEYALWLLNKGSLKEHQDGLPNYHNNFVGLTEFFVPFTEQYNVAGSAGAEVGKMADCAFCPSQEFNQLIIKAEYCLQPEHIFVEKIAQLATVYDAYFVDPEKFAPTTCGFAFTQYKNWEDPQYTVQENNTGNYFSIVPGNKWPWNVYLTNNPNVKAKLDSDKVGFFKEMIAQIGATKEAQMEWWDDIANKSSEEIICHLRQEPQNVTKSIEWPEKDIALDKMYEGNFLGLIADDEEYSIVHILSSSGATDVLSHVEGKGIKYYYDNFHDVGGGPNFTRIITLISAKINELYPIPLDKVEQYYNSSANLPSVEADLLKWSNLDYDFEEENEITIDDNTYDYKTYIGIKTTGTFTIGNIKYPKGSKLIIPAVQAALFAHVNGVAVKEKAAWVALDVGLLAVGCGGLKLAYNAASIWGKTFIIADIVGSSAGLVVQFLNNDAITDDARSKIQWAGMALSLPGILTSFDFFKTMVKDTRKMKTTYQTIDAAISAADEIILEAAKLDLKDAADALDFVRTHPKGVDVWSVLIEESDIIRKNKINLETVANHMDEVGKTADVIATEIKASGSFENWMTDYFVTYNRNGYKINSLSIDDGFNHLKNIQLNGTGKATYDNTSGLIGAHDLSVFDGELITNGGRIELVSSNTTNINGVSKMQYKVLALDIQGNPIPNQYFANGKEFLKTVYDPNVYSEILMKKIGYKGFKFAIDNNQFGAARSFIGTADNLPIAGHYKELNNDKLISTWWIDAQ